MKRFRQKQIGDGWVPMPPPQHLISLGCGHSSVEQELPHLCYLIGDEDSEVTLPIVTGLELESSSSLIPELCFSPIVPFTIDSNLVWLPTRLQAQTTDVDLLSMCFPNT